LGSELAADIGLSHRWVRVLYMSNYSRERLLSHGIEVPEPQLLKKPFVPVQLLARIRDVLSA
jgi:hypothetical protein